jgi:hypothetical protein
VTQEETAGRNAKEENAADAAERMRRCRKRKRTQRGTGKIPGGKTQQQVRRGSSNENNGEQKMRCRKQSSM